MTYATIDALVARAGEREILQVADRNSDGAADPDVIAEALANADNTIDGYIATQYVLPLPVIPGLVTTWAVSIARYWLHRNLPPENVVKDYDDAIAALKDVARGQIKLPLPSGATPTTNGGDYLIFAPAEVFGCDTLRGWR
ncbi:gp436 family protein [Pararhizobium gei]|uniref:gp436 family protein n=1 Tax=Pararhizobium gei TaxID=1395951 RepID=UPI0023DA7028|nr:DUF1320 domain-containing protein [Rhizobium gei]